MPILKSDNLEDDESRPERQLERIFSGSGLTFGELLSMEAPLSVNNGDDNNLGLGASSSTDWSKLAGNRPLSSEELTVTQDFTQAEFDSYAKNPLRINPGHIDLNGLDQSSIPPDGFTLNDIVDQGLEPKGTGEIQQALDDAIAEFKRIIEEPDSSDAISETTGGKDSPIRTAWLDLVKRYGPVKARQSATELLAKLGAINLKLCVQIAALFPTSALAGFEKRVTDDVLRKNGGGRNSVPGPDVKEIATSSGGSMDIILNLLNAIAMTAINTFISKLKINGTIVDDILMELLARPIVFGLWIFVFLHDHPLPLKVTAFAVAEIAGLITRYGEKFGGFLGSEYTPYVLAIITLLVNSGLVFS